MLEIPQRSILSQSPSVSAGRALQLLVLTVAVGAMQYARTAVSPLQETMRISLALSDNRIALLQGTALALPMVLCAIPLGLLVDKHSRVRLVFIFAVCGLIGSILTALAPNFAVLFTARCLIGLALTAFSPAVYSLVADLYRPSQRGRATMIITVGGVGGMSAAFALGGALLAMFGPGPNSWRWTMFWLTGPLVPVLFLMLALREPPRTGLTVENLSARESCAELWRYRTVIAPLLVGWVMVVIGDVAAVIWTAPTLSRSFALSPDRIGAIMATGLLMGGVIGPVAGGLLSDLCYRVGGPRRTMTVLSGLGLLSTFASLFAVMPGVAAASVLFMTLLVIGNAINVMTVSLSIVVIPNELRGLCMALLTAASGIFGVALAPLTVSLLSSALGGTDMIGRALAFVGVMTGVFGATAFAFGRRSFPRTAVQ